MEYNLDMRDLYIFNSISNKKELFVPIKPGKASIYVCGPTVYSSPHIGNFRPVVVFDVLRRLLMALGYEVTFVSNYTDVDDKIINRAKELGISEKELTSSVIEEFSSLVKEVGSIEPDQKPMPTVYMNQMIQYIGELIEKGAAYSTASGDVYFRVKSDPNYGELSGNSVEALEQGARIEINDEKEDPLDFALWKHTDEGIKWDTLWSKGRPGWHTECCVMINSIFKDQGGLIDIHGGGFDLKFPHHENEIAQSRAHNGHHLANYWMHNGFISINNEKMSKSLGNVLLAKDVCKMYGGMAFRLMILNAHYRAPVSFSEATIHEAQTNYEKISVLYRNLAVRLQLENIDLNSLKSNDTSAFYDALCDDMNTPNGLSILYEEIKRGNQLLRNRNATIGELSDCYAKLSEYFFVLGISVKYPTLSKEDKDLYKLYLKEKADKNFAESDRLRLLLQEKGIF